MVVWVEGCTMAVWVEGCTMAVWVEGCTVGVWVEGCTVGGWVEGCTVGVWVEGCTVGVWVEDCTVELNEGWTEDWVVERKEDRRGCSSSGSESDPCITIGELAVVGRKGGLSSHLVAVSSSKILCCMPESPEGPRVRA